MHRRFTVRCDVMQRDSARTEGLANMGTQAADTSFCGLARIIIGVTIATVTKRRTMVYRVIERRPAATSSRSR